MNWFTRYPVFPACFAAAFVLTRFNSTGEYPSVVVRPVLVLVAVAVAIQLALSLAARNPQIGAFFATVALAAVLDPVVALLMVLAVGAPLSVELARRRRAGRINWSRATAFLNVVAAIALFATGITSALRSTVEPHSSRAAEGNVAAEGAPDIYLILLDQYPRADTLADVFGFDNAPFLGSMQRLGFEVAANSHSNYNATALTLVSIFGANHVQTVVGDGEGGVVDGGVLQRYMNRGAALTSVREAGYDVVSIRSGITSDDVVAADKVIDTGQVNSFEISVMRAGIMPRLLPNLQAEWMHEQQRQRIVESFERLGGLAADRGERPRFVFAHVMSPHEPIVFDADGGPVAPPGCLPVSCRLWDGRRAPSDIEATIGQLEYANVLVFRTVTGIIANSARPPVIVVFSDHGSRYDVSDRDEMFRNFFLAFTPGRPGLFPADVTPINLIPRLMNAYAGSEFQLATEESYFVDLDAVETQGYLPLVQWPQT